MIARILVSWFCLSILSGLLVGALFHAGKEYEAKELAAQSWHPDLSRRASSFK